MPHNGIRALTGLATIVVLAAIVAVAVGLFQGSFTETMPVTGVQSNASTSNLATGPHSAMAHSHIVFGCGSRQIIAVAAGPK